VRVDADPDLDLQKVHPAVEWAKPEPTAVRVASRGDLHNNGVAKHPDLVLHFSPHQRSLPQRTYGSAATRAVQSPDGQTQIAMTSADHSASLPPVNAIS
jgi:hypothetical protein